MVVSSRVGQQKALLHMVLRRAEGTERWREEDLREREGVTMHRTSDRYGG